MRLPLVKVRPGGPDVARLQRLGVAPPGPVAPLPGVDPDEMAAAMDRATADATYRVEELGRRVEAAPDADSMKRGVQEGMPEVMRGIQAQIDEIMGALPSASPPAPVYPPEVAEAMRQLDAKVASDVEAFKGAVGGAQSEFAAYAANSPSEDGMVDALQSFQSGLATAGGSILQQYTGLNPVTAYDSAEALAGATTGAGALGALAGLAGAIPGGAAVAEGLGYAAQAASAVEGVDFASLLGGGSPDLAKMAGVLDAVGDSIMGEVMGMLPPEAQAAINALKQIMGAYGISMPKLSELQDFVKNPPSPKAPGCYVEGQFIATILTPTTHGSPTLPGPGALMVLYKFKPVWRTLMDFHMCPIVKGVVPDVGGVVMKGATKTIVMFGLCARTGDFVTEIPGGPNPIILMGASEPIESSDDSNDDDANQDDASDDSGDGAGEGTEGGDSGTPSDADETDADDGLNEEPKGADKTNENPDSPVGTGPDPSPAPAPGNTPPKASEDPPASNSDSPAGTGPDPLPAPAPGDTPSEAPATPPSENTNSPNGAGQNPQPGLTSLQPAGTPSPSTPIAPTDGIADAQQNAQSYLKDAAASCAVGAIRGGATTIATGVAQTTGLEGAVAGGIFAGSTLTPAAAPFGAGAGYVVGAGASVLAGAATGCAISIGCSSIVPGNSIVDAVCSVITGGGGIGPRVVDTVIDKTGEAIVKGQMQ